MAKYRKLPVVIDAWQHFDNAGQHTTAYPRWLLDAVVDGRIHNRGEKTFVDTLEGQMRVTDGDWIIKGVKGELYPCKPDIFAATYEPA